MPGTPQSTALIRSQSYASPFNSIALTGPSPVVWRQMSDVRRWRPSTSWLTLVEQVRGVERGEWDYEGRAAAAAAEQQCASVQGRRMRGCVTHDQPLTVSQLTVCGWVLQVAVSKISECSGRYVSGLLNGLTSFVNDALELHDYMAAIERHKVGAAAAGGGGGRGKEECCSSLIVRRADSRKRPHHQHV